MVREVDEDGSGDIDFGEFLELMAKQSKPPEKSDEYTTAFKYFDQGGTGKLRAIELTSIIKELGKEDCDEVIRVINDNTDAEGNVNYMNFIQKMVAVIEE